jgi:hypothetical protein
MPSTVIRSFIYEAASAELLITFRSGRRYIYCGVPEETFIAMQRAFSKGEFFNRHIRDNFPFKRVDHSVGE